MSFQVFFSSISNSMGKIIFKCLLVLLPFFVYFPSLTYENVYLDDDALTANSSAGIREIFLKDVFLGKDTKSGFYRPLMALSFYEDRHIAQFFSPKTYKYSIPPGMLLVSHFANIILHGFFCLLLYEILVCYGNAARLSFVFAALFAVLPYNAVAVSWLGGRNDVLLGIFIISSAIFLKKYADKSESVNLAAFSMFFLLALFTKETAVAFAVPAFILLFANSREKKHYFAVLAALSLPVLLYFLCRYNADLAQNAFSHINLKSVFRLPYMFCGYLMSMPLFSSMPSMAASIIAYMIFPLILFAPMFFCYKKVPYGLAGIAWFLFFLAPPLLSTDSPDGWFYMRHRLYVPLAGLSLYVLPLCEKFLSGIKNPWAFFAVFFVFFCINSAIDSINFKNRLEFSIKQAEENRKKLPYFMHTAGGWHFEHREYDFSYMYYKKARQSGYETAFSILQTAAMEMQKGNIKAAHEEIKRGTEKFPGDPYLKENMARLAQAGY